MLRGCRHGLNWAGSVYSDHVETNVSVMCSTVIAEHRLRNTLVPMAEQCVIASGRAVRIDKLFFGHHTLQSFSEKVLCFSIKPSALHLILSMTNRSAAAVAQFDELAVNAEQDKSLISCRVITRFILSSG